MIKERLRLTRMAGGVGLVLPQEVLDWLQVHEGEEVCLVEEKGSLRITSEDDTRKLYLAAFQEGRTQYKNALRKLAE